MSSTYSNLKFELIGTGEQSGTWGATTNTNIGTAIEQAIVGMATLTSSDFTANVATLTLTNTSAAQNARALCLNIAAGAVSAAGTINVPAIQKPYIVINGSSYTVTVKVSGLTGVAVPAGTRTTVYNNGTDVGVQENYFSALTLGAALPITSGGTGSTSTTFVNLATNVTGTLPATNGGTGQTSFAIGDTFYASTTTAISKLGIGTSNQVLTVVAGVPTWVSPTAASYPGAGIANSTGSAWGTSYTTTGSGTVVALATSPTLVTPLLGTPTSGTLSNCTVDGTNSVGFINIPINSQSADYTLVLADSGKAILHPSSDANARTFTIPANSSVAYAIGTAVTFINMTSQVVSIAITTDTLYLGKDGLTGTRSLAQYGTATAIKLTSTTWIINGSGLT
jgi:hypothetical protein